MKLLKRGAAALLCVGILASASIAAFAYPVSKSGTAYKKASVTRTSYTASGTIIRCDHIPVSNKLSAQIQYQYKSGNNYYNGTSSVQEERDVYSKTASVSTASGMVINYVKGWFFASCYRDGSNEAAICEL